MAAPTTSKPRTSSTSSLDIGAVRGKVASNPNLDPELIAKRIEEATAEPEVVKPSFSVPKELKGLEDLIFLGAGTKDVQFGDFTFQLATLTSKEQESIYKGSLTVQQEERGFYFKRSLVATALRKINGRFLSSYFESDTLDARLELVDNLQNSIFEGLYKELESLISDTSKSLTAENLKK